MSKYDKRNNRYSPDYKLEIVKLAKKGYALEQISEVSGIPRTTITCWVDKYDENGEKGLSNQRQWSKVELIKKPQVVIDKIMRLRAENPALGAEKISGYLARNNLIKICGETVRKIINKFSAETPACQTEGLSERTLTLVRNHKLKRRKKTRKFNKPKQVRYFERATPNALWQMDIMTFMLKGLYRTYLVGVIDDNSRYIINHGLFRRQTEDNVLDVLRGAIERSGCPKEVLTDNGRQFYSWRGKSKFSKFCIKSGIQHIRSRPYHPQTLGKIESFWRNLYQEFLGNVPLSSFEEAQTKIAEWIKYYNYQRIHLGIGKLVPADRYFGVRAQMEKVIQEGSAETEKLLKENPSELKSPMYLVGKIGDREIRVLAKNGEIMVSDEKSKTSEPAAPIESASPLENATKNIVESIPADISAEEKKIVAVSETNPPEVKSDGPEPKPESATKSEPGTETAAGTGTADIVADGLPAGLSCETGEQVPPKDLRAGEDGSGAECPEKRDDGGAGVSGDEHGETVPH
ncbi:MAG: transposase [Elusimicrobia bacterium]|nr:transposase [Elusimicrobiota bacterium]